MLLRRDASADWEVASSWEARGAAVKIAAPVANRSARNATRGRVMMKVCFRISYKPRRTPGVRAQVFNWAPTTRLKARPFKAQSGDWDGGQHKEIAEVAPSVSRSGLGAAPRSASAKPTKARPMVQIQTLSFMGADRLRAPGKS